MDPVQARERMVIEQLQRRGISDQRVLKAMREIPRDRFIAAEYAERAYDDGPLPIGAEQTISQPYMVALMTEIAELDGSEKVLEIGTGCGYQTAILARLAHSVYTIEIIAELQTRAQATLRDLGVHNCYFRLGDGSEGWPEAAPFDVIIVTAALPAIPRALLAQLTENGRLIAPVGEEELQTLVRLERDNGRWQEHYFGECRFVKMAGKAGFGT
jgi:protein-L-isoaspartate(D-aspartate) O-methyltransferase